MHLIMSGNWRPYCFGLIMLTGTRKCNAKRKSPWRGIPADRHLKRLLTWCRHGLDTLRPRQNGRHFADDICKGIYLNENFSILHKNFTAICSLGSNRHNGSIVSDDGLAPNRRQAIIWTNVDMLYWRIYAPLGLNELKSMPVRSIMRNHKRTRG